MAEEEPKTGVAVDELRRARATGAVRLGIDADDRDALAVALDRRLLVAEEPRLLEVAQLGGPRERIARHGDVVVSEDHERVVEPLEQLAQARLAARVRDEVSGDADEVGPPLRDPVDGARARAVAARQRRAEVEVGQVPDPEPVERRGEPVDRDLEHPRAQPAGLEPAVDGTGERERSEDDDGREHLGSLEVP